MAAALTALVVAGCLVYSVFVGPVSVARVQPGDWIADQANVLSESTEDSLRSYDQSFDNNYSSVIAVATVSSTRGWEMEDYALKLADQWELGAKDLVLLLDIGGKDAYLLGGSAWTDLEPSELLNQTMAADFYSGNYDSAVLSLFSAMSGWYPDHGGYARSDPYAGYNQQSHGNSSSFGGFSVILRIILIVLVIYLIVAAIERARYRRWYRDYGAMTAPAVVFTPIFPWHRPGSSWYNRMGHPRPQTRRSRPQTRRSRPQTRRSGSSAQFLPARTRPGSSQFASPESSPSQRTFPACVPAQHALPAQRRYEQGRQLRRRPDRRQQLFRPALSPQRSLSPQLLLPAQPSQRRGQPRRKLWRRPWRRLWRPQVIPMSQICPVCFGTQGFCANA